METSGASGAEPGPTVLLAASAPRRVIGVGTLGLLGLFLVVIGVTQPTEIGWRAALVAGGALTVWAARTVWRVTGHPIVLDDGGLRTQDGRTLARLADIARVERGPFAVKPSSGFTLTLRTAAPFGWAPGMWWRVGRRLGVGGVVSPGATKAAAEILSARLATRADTGSDPT